MGIAAQFGNSAITNPVLEFQQRLEQAVMFVMSYLGERLAAYAKDHHTYTDRTGNLTNSIGYAIAKNGNIVQYSGTDQPGVASEESLKVAVEMARRLPADYSLLIVAGMNYAAYVEAKGYDVILPAQLMCAKEFPKMMKTLQAKAMALAQKQFKL